MPNAVLYLIISLLAFLILTDTVTVRYIHGSGRRIDIDMTVFGLTLTPKKSRRDTSSKSDTKPSPLKKLPMLLRGSYVRLRRICITLKAKDPARYALLYAGCHAALAPILSYLKKYSRYFYYDDIFIKASDNNKTEIEADISATTSLLYFGVCLISYLFSAISGKIKRNGAKNV